MQSSNRLKNVIKLSATFFGLYAMIRTVVLFVVLGNKYLPSIVLGTLVGLIALILTSNIWSKSGMLTMSFLISLMIADIIGFVCHFFVSNDIYVKLWMFGIYGIGFTFLLLLYGLINETFVRKKKYSFSSSKIKSKKRFVFISDVHFATIQSEKILKNKIDEINSLDCDFLVLGGDVVEEKTPKDKLAEVFEILGNVKTRCGTFFVHGNHDRYAGEEFDELLKKSGIVCIDDDVLQIDDDVELIGRDDYSVGERKKVSELIGKTSQSRYRILIEHQPTDVDEISKSGVELCLAGHYHGAQNLPNNIIYRLSNVYYNGMYKINDMALCVSSGFAGSKYRTRTHSHCEYLLIEISGDKDEI